MDPSGYMKPGLSCIGMGQPSPNSLLRKSFSPALPPGQLPAQRRSSRGPLVVLHLVGALRDPDLWPWFPLRFGLWKPATSQRVHVSIWYIQGLKEGATSLLWGQVCTVMIFGPFGSMRPFCRWASEYMRDVVFERQCFMYAIAHRC